ncbi:MULTISPECIES: hypothetical protein [Sphingomonas]|uniref:hypothetical protein n=1 Tax=Sphingomonas TaxID=13687 RepID=UPI000F7DBF80|nr:hypothetical protein [Sphingomonas sp. ABOLF]RSV17889.1 hypothetical protein CA235_00345 [Sphingomonas sp. ABOLF]GLK20665.1 hypothetical protein GCM10017606_14910 [Microbacterium terregens]
MTIRVVAAAAALVLGVATVAAPAMAEPRTVPAPATTTTTESVDTASTTSGTKAKRETRYCAETEITGSRLPRRQCQTREDWLRDGVDPLDYLPR